MDGIKVNGEDALLIALGDMKAISLYRDKDEVRVEKYSERGLRYEEIIA